MTDELEELRKAFREEGGIEGRAARRKAAIDAAMRAFDEEKSKSAQGTGLADRLRDRGNTFVHFLKRRRSMRLSYTLAGGASLAVLTLAVLNTGYLMTTGPNDMNPFKQPVLEDAETDAKPANEAPALDGLLATRRDADEGGRPADGRARQALAPAPEQAPAPTAGGLGVSAVPGEVKRERRIGASRPQIALKPQSSADDATAQYYRDQGRDRFAEIETNPVKQVTEEPVSTFSVDVDTASYSFVRAALNRNVLPQKDAVRVEELINYFPYDYQGPADREAPFKANVTVLPSPWNAGTRLMHIGIKGFDIERAEKPRSNLVFLLDTSGSMNAPNKLPLLRNSFKLLLSTLDPDDTVAIVTYAGGAGTVLEPTKVRDKGRILAALDNLNAGGSTAGAEGIRQAYNLAERNFDKEGVNRVLLATDGDFNVGITDRDELKSYIERKRETGIMLSVLGFGMGNYNDELMQTLAQNGNGVAAYIDSLSEARKVLVEEAGSTLFTIAGDVKIQMEFNPQTVSEYRLIGYETRMLKREDFNNDKVDAGDIGSGHRVTAIYEFAPKGSDGTLIDPSRYAKPQTTGDGYVNEYGFLKIRYKLPGETESKLISTPVTKAEEVGSVAAAPTETRFAAAVAGFGQLLRGGRYTGAFAYDDVIALAQGARGEDRFGYRAEFINLVRLAKSAAAMEPLKQR